MAEGGEEESMTPFQEATEQMCSVCLRDDSFKVGPWYCQQCRQRLCDKCRRYHRNVSSTQSHEIIRADEMPATSPQPQEGVSDEIPIPMCQTHNEPIEYYCKTHSTPACGTCKLMNHRKCQLQDLEHAAEGSTGKNLHVLYQLRETEAHMKKIGEVIGNEKESLEAQKDEAIEKIQRKMKELEALEKKKIAEVQGKFQQEREGLDREACVIKKSSMLVEKSIKELERATNVGSEEEIFLATRQAEDDVSKFHDIVRESSQVSHAEMIFEVNNRLTDITSIGNVIVEKATISVDLTPEITEVLNTKQSEYQIRWVDVLPSDQMILLGLDPTSRTSQLSLYSANKKLESKLDLPCAVSAAMLDDHQVIVPLPDNKQLQIVNTDNDKLTQDRAIKTDVLPALILKYSDSSVLVLAQQHDVKCCLQILDLTGKVEKHIMPCTDLQSPMFMRMSHKKDAVYIVDHKKGCLGFNLQGDVMFHYINRDYDVYSGLARDPHGALFFSARKQDQGFKCVIKLSPAGQVLRQIDIGGIHPVQCIRNKMYVAGFNDQKERILSYFYV